MGSVLFGRYLLRMCVAIVTMIKGALDKYYCLVSSKKVKMFILLEVLV